METPTTTFESTEIGCTLAERYGRLIDDAVCRDCPTPRECYREDWCRADVNGDGS